VWLVTAAPVEIATVIARRLGLTGARARCPRCGRVSSGSERRLRGQRRRRWRAMAAAVPPATAPTPAAAGMPTFAALRAVR
ncbi:hypothetical protein EAO69_28520, partial [Streptomyces sp. me109]